MSDYNEITAIITTEEPAVAATLDELRYLVFNGKKGDKGDSAYEEAVKLGFEGTEEEWLASLKGATGERGPAAIVKAYLDDGVVRFIESYDGYATDDVYTAIAMQQHINNGALPFVCYSPVDDDFVYFELDALHDHATNPIVYFRSKEYLLTVDATGRYTLANRPQGSGLSDAVLYTEQELTPAQKAQARENIGAFSSDAGDEIRDAFETRQVAGSSNLLNPAEAIDGYFITNTNDTPAVNANYYYSDFMPVDAGKTYTLQRGGLTVAQGRAIAGIKWIAAYDESKTLQTTKGSAGISAGNGYTVPEGVAYVRICASKVYWPLTSHNVAFVEGMEPQDYTPYVVPTETLGALKPAYHDDEHILSLIDAHDGETSGLTYSFDLDTNGFTADEDTQDAQDYSIAFTAPISSGFEGVIIGRGYNAAYGGWVKVTGTEVSYGLGTEAEPRATYTHGLTLADYIAVKLIADAGTTMTLTVSTNGGEWSKSRLTWDCMKGVLSVQPVGNTTLSGCNLGYWCNGWAASTQLYGDSYFGKYASKWTSYLVANGCTDVLVNGYPGRASATALTAAKTVLAHSQPKRIVWCVGMNNGDTGGVVNAAWKVAVDELGSICDARGVELILATIPNVATVDNTYKNAYVRASGRRYIDFASAVGAENDTTWYGGMLSSDGVHPAVPGALALYRQAIADVPELMEKQDVPTKTSDLTNDSGYQTASDVQTAIAGVRQLPTVTSSDNGKFLRVVSGAWAAQAVQTYQGGSY